MATAAMTAVFPAPGTSYPGSVGRGVLTDRGCGKPRLDLDFTLVERCLSGDATGWEELVRLHTRRVYGLCYRFTGSDTEAQDLTQDIFLRVFRSLKVACSVAFGTTTEYWPVDRCWMRLSARGAAVVVVPSLDVPL